MSKRIHILGICGTFMGSLAILARQKGYEVTGSDIDVYPPMSTYLQSQGIQISQGFDCSQLDPSLDEIIIGNIMIRGMPIVEKILTEKLNYSSGPKWLYENILKYKKVIAVAGTHGKTTTTAMIIKILEQAGLNPSFLVGGISNDLGISSRYTDSQYFIIEADEYSTAFFDKYSKFVHYDPDILVINNLEYEHADIFKDVNDILWQFHQLIVRMPSTAKIIYNANNQDIQSIINTGCWSDTIKMNPSKITTSKNALDYSVFSIKRSKQQSIKISWKLVGKHNALNAMSADTVAKQLDISDDCIVEALENFNGVKRRLEVLHNSKDVVLYDDFAHHPTAIKLTLEALRNKASQAYIIAIIDPRSNTMKRGDNKDMLPGAITSADKVLLYNHDLLKWNAKKVFRNSSNIDLINDIDELIDAVKTLLAKYQTRNIQIVMMSNRLPDGLKEKLIKLLEARCVI